MYGEITRKTRSTLTGQANVNEYRTSFGGTWFPGSTVNLTLDEYVWSHSHGRNWYQDSQKGENVGGDFISVKTGWTHYDAFHYSDSVLNRGNCVYGTPTVGNGYVEKSPTFAPRQGTALPDLRAKGTKAIAATIPTAPAVSLPNVIGELLLDGLPKLGLHVLQSTFKNLLKKGSEDFLNFEFGWKPFLNDLKQIVRTCTHAQDIMDQYVRDSGRSVRRRYAGSSSFQSWAYNGIGTCNPIIGNVQCNLSINEFYVVNWWFSGRFKYYLPSGDDYWSKAQYRRALANRVLGVGGTFAPSLSSLSQLYELTPWTWLIDWVTDLGDIVKNVSYLGVDGLVLEYGYVMQTDHTTRDYIGTVYSSGRSTVPIGTRFTARYESVRKYRSKATPYGFEILPNAFSGKQWAILVALGLARGSTEPKIGP